MDEQPVSLRRDVAAREEFVSSLDTAGIHPTGQDSSFTLETQIVTELVMIATQSPQFNIMTHSSKSTGFSVCKTPCQSSDLTQIVQRRSTETCVCPNVKQFRRGNNDNVLACIKPMKSKQIASLSEESIEKLSHN